MGQLKGTIVKQFRVGNSKSGQQITLCYALESKIKLWVDLRELLDQLIFVAGTSSLVYLSCQNYFEVRLR